MGLSVSFCPAEDGFHVSMTEHFLLAVAVVYTLPYLFWRLCNTDFFAPLVVVQMLFGVLAGPSIFGRLAPEGYHQIFTPEVSTSLNGVSWLATLIFVWIAGVELDQRQAWTYRGETIVVAVLSMSVPLIMGASFAYLLCDDPGWIGPEVHKSQFAIGVGMACSVTALPILIMFLERMNLLKHPLGQRVLRYASLDDLMIWVVLALALMDVSRIGKQSLFLVCFSVACVGFRRLLLHLSPRDRWYLGLIWVTVCAFAADFAELHFVIGAFLAGVVLDSTFLGESRLVALRENILMLLMPIFFLNSGLKTRWDLGGYEVFWVGISLLIVSVAGKMIGVRLAGMRLGWKSNEASFLGWVLQTKGPYTIIFANILLEDAIITHKAYTSIVLMAILSTMLTFPMVQPKLRRILAHPAEHLDRGG